MPRFAFHLVWGLASFIIGITGFFLVSYGGIRVWQALMRLELATSYAAMGWVLQLAGAALLVAAIMAAWFSPAGLIGLGALGIVVLGLSAFPEVLFAVRLPFLSPLIMLSQTISAGIPQTLGALMGMTGLVVALYMQKRKSLVEALPQREKAAPAGTAIGHVVGIVTAPVLFFFGLILLLRGINSAFFASRSGMPFSVDPIWPVALLAGFVLIAAAALTLRWSPFSLILPAALVALLTVASFVPAFARTLFTFQPSPIVFFATGGIAATAVLLGCSAVAIRHWSVNRRAAAQQPGPSQAGPSQAGPSQAGPLHAGPSQAGPTQPYPHPQYPHPQYPNQPHSPQTHPRPPHPPSPHS